MQPERQHLQRAVNPDIAPGSALHWYDFICPFCYVGQHRTGLLEAGGLHVVEMSFQAHPETPAEGKYLGPRSGSMYDMLNREAAEAGLPLLWPDRMPNTRLALSYAEWIRENAASSFRSFQRHVFAAHFALRQDIGNVSVLDGYAKDAGVDLPQLRNAIVDGSAYQALERSERLGTSLGVHGTPAWFVSGRLISGLRPASEFRTLAQALPLH